MTSTHSLDLVFKDASSPPDPNENLILLSEFLKPNSTMTLEFAASKIERSLPDDGSDSAEVWRFGETCIHIAKQIRYDHPSQLKLAGLLEHLASFPKLVVLVPIEVCRFHYIAFLHPVSLMMLKGTRHQYVQFQQLGWALRDHLYGMSCDLLLVRFCVKES